MRRVKYTRLVFIGVKPETETGEAFFHGFGVDYEEFESGPGAFSVAILELDSGEVIMPRADDITFLDKPENDNENP